MSALQLAIQVATRKRDDESRLVAQALRKLQGAQAQLTQLHAYADESHGRWSAQTGRVLNPALMAHHYQFMDRLRHATGLQDGVVLQMNRQLEAARKHLMAAECRLAVLEKVLEKQRLSLQKKQDQREQRQTDELASRRLENHTFFSNREVFT